MEIISCRYDTSVNTDILFCHAAFSLFLASWLAYSVLATDIWFCHATFSLFLSSWLAYSVLAADLGISKLYVRKGIFR